jgi:hypothetical protein
VINAGGWVTYVESESRRASYISDDNAGQQWQAARQDCEYQGACENWRRIIARQKSHVPALTSATFILALPLSVLLANGTGTQDALPAFISVIG